MMKWFKALRSFWEDREHPVTYPLHVLNGDKVRLCEKTHTPVADHIKIRVFVSEYMITEAKTFNNMSELKEYLSDKVPIN